MLYNKLLHGRQPSAREREREREREMERYEKGNEVHVVVVPCPAQGHINPLLQFSKHLACRGLKVTLCTIFIHNGSNSTQTHLPETTSLTVDQIPLLPYQGTEPEDSKSYWDRRHTSIRLHLTEFLARHETACTPVACVVYDSIIPWVLDIIKQFGILGASFFTQSCAVNSIYYNVHKGWIDVPLQKSSVSLDGFPILQNSDLPSFVSDVVNYPSILSFMADQFTRLKDVDWVFVNTFDCLEQEEVVWMESQHPFKNIGPMVPSIYSEGQLKDDKDNGLSLCETNMDSTMNWLNSKANSSVIYVSFGSITELGKEQMEELAMGLKMSNRFFLWVVRESEIQKLPINFIEEETSEKGLVVNWCPQMEVLGHKAIGCFVSHCGWNSTLEALSLGVAMVAMPQWTDQPTNAKYVEDVWKIGRRVRVGEDGIVKREQILLCINEVMEGEMNIEIKENLRKWMELAKGALDQHGTSNNNINEFVEKLLK